MVFQPGQKPISKPKEKKENCVIDVRRTKTGKRITFRGKCSPRELDLARQTETSDFED